MVQRGLRLIMVMVMLGPALGVMADEMPPRPSETPTWVPVQPGTTPAPTPVPDPEYVAAKDLGSDLAEIDLGLWEIFDARRAEGEASMLAAVDAHLDGNRERVKDAVRGFEVMQCRRDGETGTASLVIPDAMLRQSFLQGYMPAVTRFRAVRSTADTDADVGALFDAVKARQSDFQDRICSELEEEPKRRIIATPKLGSRAGSKSSTF